MNVKIARTAEHKEPQRRQVEQWLAEQKTNPLWPLPADFNSLTSDGKKQARLAVVMRQSTPAELVIAWESFCNFFLNWEGSGFYRGFKQYAPFHYTLVHDMASYPLNMISGPRNSAKTTTLKSIVLFLACTRPRFGVLWVKSNLDAAKRDFGDLMMQLDENERIRNYFGRLRKEKGSGGWSRRSIQLRNNFKIINTALDSANRGERQPLAILDDVEFDEANPQRADELTVITERKIKHVFLPMMELEGTCLFFVGTIRMNSYLFRAIHSSDPTMDYWNRRHVAIESEEGLYWPEKFGKKEIKQLRGRLGPAAFGAEYMGQPQPDDRAVLAFDPMYHSYQVKGSAEDWIEAPFDVETIIVRRVRGQPMKGIADTYREYDAEMLLKHGFRFITVDYSLARSYTSDFSGAAVWMMDHDGVLWSLDLYLRRATEPELVDKIVSLAKKWRVRLIAPESVALQTHLSEKIRNSLEERFREECGYVPAVMPLKGRDFLSSKSERICTTQWRFCDDKIVLPAHRLDSWPYRELRNQIMAFNGDTECMKYDDAVDMLGMTTQVLRDRKVGQPHKPEEQSWIEKAAADPKGLQSGVNPFFCVDINRMTDKDISDLERVSAVPHRRPGLRRYSLSRKKAADGLNLPIKKTEMGWTPIVSPLYSSSP